MKLIKIEAHGFKSFADPVVLHFDGGVTGIVGPNGSGKSNINDAIKWVLGEQSSKELRGDNMHDVIFAGSKTVKALDKAEVTLTFDNRLGASSFPSEIITISRVLERGKGANQYYINGELCRHKDIKAIAMETGIGKSSLAIISQGTVADIAESTDEQRRAIFEEAAGVSKYKFRKLDAIKKLERTTDSLEKIGLVVSELEKQITPLRKQASKAKEYLEKTAQLKDVEIALLAHDIQQYDQQFKQLTNDLEGVEETKKDYTEKIENFELRLNKSIPLRDTLHKEITALMGKAKGINERLKDLEIIASKESHRQELIARGEIKVSSHEQIESLKSLLEQTSHKISYFKDEEEILKNKSNHYSKEVNELNENINELTIQINDKKTKKVKLETKLQILEDQKENKTNLFKGTKTIVENKSLFKGYHGIVADLIKVNPEYVTAIETVLSNATQHIVVEDSEVAVKAVNFLKSNNSGRATFIPLKSIQAKSIRDDHMLVIQTQPGYIGIASELVDIEPKFEILNKFLLGNIIVVEDIETANKVANILDKKYMVVTKDGDVVRVGGIIVGGSKERSQNLIGSDDQIREIKELIPGLNSLIKAQEDKILDFRSKRSNIYQYNSEIQKELSALIEKRVNTQNKFAELQSKFASLSKEELKFDNESGKNVENIEILESQLRATSADLRAKNEIFDNLNAEINSLSISKNDLEKNLRDLNSSFSKKIAMQERAKIYFEQSRERLISHYKITVENAIKEYKLSISIDEAREFVETTRDEISALGHINLESIEELKEKEERFNMLSSNQEELYQAKETITSAIAEMDKIITTKLTNIVEDVNIEFDNVFRTMFGGGNAKIAFVDPKNILESGISIEAQPPGKSIKNLKLFSGGEKSLIAISLLFGILKARPLPLCILDEVEAALDEANVVRFAEYLQALKEKTQFVVITHRHGSMSRMDNLFGATMQKRGVTSFFSLELSQAKKMVDEFNKAENK
ncbi:AAA family ATPase [Mycoplasma crocodyli]|uniref:Chromosome partition protein Smc n=1 Tax=Mycoplasma crocodyli (strain ATCC 51981 / MP145) TaxID=512564 RepID=D5E4P4_MYCCM|nr:AAA family ATPase [Mycoplasma crocodyli]ADE19649.1 chromosomal segregation and condensation complex, SMC protein [Mycoplasma crocodyli MP145]